jgi:hypothetical protein
MSLNNSVIKIICYYKVNFFITNIMAPPSHRTFGLPAPNTAQPYRTGEPSSQLSYRELHFGTLSASVLLVMH